MEFNQTSFDLPTFLHQLTPHPGVYRMYDAKGQLIYVGKAKNLYKRVNSYFSKGAKDQKTMTMVPQITYIEVTVTASDYEAFLLESTLIKRYRPKYNILFKDDKSYPYLVLSHHTFARLYSFRGQPDPKDGQTYFGPYASLASVKETLTLLQKLFPIRQCSQHFYKTRQRPCLQHQIGRCPAPCVNQVSKTVYDQQVELFKQFMQGKLSDVLQIIGQQMQQSADDLDFEKAAKLRDQLQTLQKLQQQQIVHKTQQTSAFDVIGMEATSQQASINILQVNHGQIQSDQHWSIAAALETNKTILQAFLSYYYLTQPRQFWPKRVILPPGIEVDSALLDTINQQAGHIIQWHNAPRSDGLRWQKLAQTNAMEKNHIQLDEAAYKQRFIALANWLGYPPEQLQTIECFDISHFQGDHTVAGCVVFTQQGPDRKAYRHYNIDNIVPGDDYSAMEQALTRRIASYQKHQHWPDLVVIDGGKGQLRVAEDVFSAHGLEKIQLISLGKGQARISGQETIYCGDDDQGYHLPPHDVAFLLLRHIRDQAHEHALKGQHRKRHRQQHQSILDTIPGIGPKRKYALLNYFGGWQALSQASCDEIQKVPGVSKSLAKIIYQTVHTR